MLALYSSSAFTSCFCSAYILFILTLLINNTVYVFYKIWAVFGYLLTQSLLLGYWGEDFFVIVILAAEVPVFFAFFFFCVTKTQLGVPAESRILGVSSVVWFFAASSFLLFTSNLTNTAGLCNHYFADQLVLAEQRSDFFIFYFSFLLVAGQFIFFVGLLITVVTLILLFFTFKNQVNSLNFLKKTKTISWVRVQDTQIQNSQRRVFTYFRR